VGSSENPVNVAASPLQAAMAAHKGGRLAEAEAGYRGILQENPEDADALNFLGMLKCQSGDLPGALVHLRRSVVAVPTNPHAWVNLGNVLLASGEAHEARAALTKATELAPEMALAWYNLGVCFGRCRLPHEAASALHKALQIQPGHIPAYESLAILLYRLGNFAEAAEVYREWLKYEPENPIARHMLAATSGDHTPARADDQYVRAMFDAFSLSFDENLKNLGYRAPHLVADVLAAEKGQHGALEVLDAGCGTGLCGALVRPMASRLVGVDLSSGMLEKARARAVYDELVTEELCAFMRSRQASFDVVLCADTLVYFGALYEPLQAMRYCLRISGMTVITLEELGPDPAAEPYRLEPHGRYAHRESYVADVLAACGFGRISIERSTLRRERGSEVRGLIVRAHAS